MTTNAELTKELEVVKAEMEALKSALGQVAPGPHQEQRNLGFPEAEPGPGGGWIVIAPNQYSEPAAGIKFHGGFGVVDFDTPTAGDKLRLCAEFGYQIYGTNAEGIAIVRRYQAEWNDIDRSTMVDKITQSQVF